jgi:hypothetical protein
MFSHFGNNAVEFLLIPERLESDTFGNADRDLTESFNWQMGSGRCIFAYEGRDGCHTRITRGCIKQKTALQVFLFPAINRVKMFVAAFHQGLLFSYFTQDKVDNAFFGFLVFNAS